MRLFNFSPARSLLTLAILLAIGISGYMLIEGWSLLDAAYMTILTFTTVGYAEVRPLSQEGRIFTIFTMVAGVGVMLYILTSAVHMVVEQEVLRNLVRRHTMRTRISRLSGHYIVCGFGRVGRAVALKLQQEGVQLVVVDTSETAVGDADECGLLAVHGDPAGDGVLRSAHIDGAAGLIAATGNDVDNVYISLTARGLNPGLHIVARASLPEAEDKLLRAGADRVISPYAIGGEHMATAAIEGRPINLSNRREAKPEPHA